jgi:hypothetical protein
MRQQVDSVAGYYALRPLAKELGTTPKALREYCRRNGIETIQLGSQILVTLESLKNYRVRLGAVMDFQCVQ